MIKNRSICSKKIKSFYEEVRGIKKIKQDTIFHSQKYKLNQKYFEKRNIYQEDAHSYFFKSNFSQKIIKKNPVSYVRDELCRKELKKLKNKEYFPELFLDFHGVNQNTAKKELGKLFFFCKKEKIFCFAIIHGHGKNILKRNVPIWLSQHPDTIAFYQEPNIFGHNTTLFGLLQK
ncbi:endonuclease SmrB [Buchnera aphidicola]|uniref:endonuclease SmrB n=1 Tax=Buchnera aphidicola TaxID=9 RepID=UPI0034640CE3